MQQGQECQEMTQKQAMVKYWTVLSEHMFCSLEKVGKLTATLQCTYTNVYNSISRMMT